MSISMPFCNLVHGYQRKRQRLNGKYLVENDTPIFANQSESKCGICDVYNETAFWLGIKKKVIVNAQM